MNGDITAIGPFTRTIAHLLGHPEDAYLSTPEGTRVIANIVTCPGSTTTRELAAACGVDPWDFARHVLDPARVDADALDALSERLGQPGLGQTFLALQEHGFKFYFMPNG